MNNFQSLPFEPQPVPTLKARFKDAMFLTWVISPNMTTFPGAHRDHVFDFDSGLDNKIIQEQSAIDHLLFFRRAAK